MARILIVEDEAPLRSAMARYLRATGHVIDEVPDGRRAVRFLESATDVDLVITDINMPHMDGIEVIRAIESAAPKVRVLAVSGGGLFPKEMLLAQARHLGAIATLTKPFELARLGEVVDELLRANTGPSGA